MKIDLYCACACNDEDNVFIMSGCGILCSYVDDYDRKKFRSYRYGLGSSNKRLANIQAARLALVSVRSAFRHSKTCLHISDEYIIEILAKKGRSFVLKTPDSYQATITDLRKWFGFYDNISIVVESDDNKYMQYALNMAKIGLTTQERWDSGTFDTL